MPKLKKWLNKIHFGLFCFLKNSWFPVVGVIGFMVICLDNIIVEIKYTEILDAEMIHADALLPQKSLPNPAFLDSIQALKDRAANLKSSYIIGTSPPYKSSDYLLLALVAFLMLAVLSVVANGQKQGYYEPEIPKVFFTNFFGFLVLGVPSLYVFGFDDYGFAFYLTGYAFLYGLGSALIRYKFDASFLNEQIEESLKLERLKMMYDKWWRALKGFLTVFTAVAITGGYTFIISDYERTLRRAAGIRLEAIDELSQWNIYGAVIAVVYGAAMVALGVILRGVIRIVNEIEAHVTRRRFLILDR